MAQKDNKKTLICALAGVCIVVIIAVVAVIAVKNNSSTGDTNDVKNGKEISDNSQENNNFILKDHKGYYNETKDKYIVEGTLVNKTDETLEDKYVMIRLYSEDEKMISVAEYLVEKIEPHAEIKIIANTPTLSENAREIVKYVLSSL